MNNIKKITAFVLSFILIISCFCAYTSAENYSNRDMAVSGNIYGNRYSYNRFGNTVKSHLSSLPDGPFVRTEYIDGVIYEERYNSRFELVSSLSVPTELPVYGGIYSGKKYNYLVTGQNNPDDSDDVEVIRVSRYTKDWKKEDSVSVYGENTYMPFDVGAVRFVEAGKYLYVYTAHEMYMTSDGKHHQANMMIVVDTEKMEATYINSAITNIRYGYISHSFNQFITVDEETNSIITADHGDARPRGIALLRYANQAGNSTLSSPANVEVFSFSGESGDNDTYASLGGLVVTENNYLIVLSSANQKNINTSNLIKDVYVTVTPKNNFSTEATKQINLTNYKETGVQSADTPYITPVGGKYLVMWNNMVSGKYNNTVSYVFIDENGNKLSDIHTSSAVLSDCEPILSGSKVIWYATKNSAPVFFSVNINNPEKIVTEKCNHIYNENILVEKTCDIDGITQYVCAFCGYEHTAAVPASGHTSGRADGRCSTCGNYIPTGTSTSKAVFDKEYYEPGSKTAVLTLYLNNGARFETLSTSGAFSARLFGNRIEFDISNYDEGIHRIYIKLTDGVITADIIISKDGKIPSVPEKPTEEATTEKSTMETTTAPEPDKTTEPASDAAVTTQPDTTTAPGVGNDDQTSTTVPQPTTTEAPPSTTEQPSKSDETTTETPKYMMGDMNNDGKITSADARIALRISAKLQPADEYLLLCGDVNRDNKITSADARLILRVAAKLDTF